MASPNITKNRAWTPFCPEHQKCCHQRHFDYTKVLLKSDLGAN